MGHLIIRTSLRLLGSVKPAKKDYVESAEGLSVSGAV